MTERNDVVTFKGGPITLVGTAVQVGEQAPDFQLVGTDLSDVTSDSFRGKVLVLSVMPSIDTPVCQAQTRKFNEEGSALSDDLIILTVSLDLPFALKRFCGAEGLERVTTASDFKYHSFAEDYGVYIKELGLLTRAVFVVDRQGKLTHVEYVAEATDEPNYETALEAVKAAL